MFHTTTDCTQLFWKKHCVYQFSDLTLVRMKNIGANFHCKKRVLKKLLRFTQQLNARNCFGKSIVTNVQQVKLFDAKLCNSKCYCLIYLKFSGLMCLGTKKNTFRCKKLTTKKLLHFTQQLTAPGFFRKHLQL